MKTNLFKYIISPNATIEEAYLKMLKNRKKIILICDESYKVYGLLTEGDFLRIFWSNINQKNNVMTIGKKKKFFSTRSKSKISLNSLKKTNINHIPIIRKGILKDIIFDYKLGNKNRFEKKKIKFSAAILAGGFGKRLYPVTKKIPKALAPINTVPIISIIIENLVRFNLNKIYLALFHKKRLIKKYFYNKKIIKKIRYIEENKPYGTAGPLSKIEKKIKNPIVVTNCDTILNYNYDEILRYHLLNKLDVTVVGFIYENNLKYGVFNMSKKGKLISIIEKPKINHVANCGFYVFNSKVLNLIETNKYLDMNVFLKKLIYLKKKIGVFPVPKNSWIDIGSLEDYKRANKI